MSLKDNKISAKKELQLSRKNAKLHHCTGTKRHKEWNFREFV